MCWLLISTLVDIPRVTGMWQSYQISNTIVDLLEEVYEIEANECQIFKICKISRKESRLSDNESYKKVRDVLRAERVAYSIIRQRRYLKILTNMWNGGERANTGHFLSFWVVEESPHLVVELTSFERKLIQAIFDGEWRRKTKLDLHHIKIASGCEKTNI